MGHSQGVRKKTSNQPLFVDSLFDCGERVVNSRSTACSLQEGRYYERGGRLVREGKQQQLLFPERRRWRDVSVIRGTNSWITRCHCAIPGADKDNHPAFDVRRTPQRPSQIVVEGDYVDPYWVYCMHPKRT